MLANLDDTPSLRADSRRTRPLGGGIGLLHVTPRQRPLVVPLRLVVGVESNAPPLPLSHRQQSRRAVRQYSNSVPSGGMPQSCASLRLEGA